MAGASKDLTALASGEQDSRDAVDLRERLSRRAFSARRQDTYKRGMSLEEAEVRLSKRLADIRGAFELGRERYTARLRGELAASERRMHEAQPRAGTYEHELALMRARGRDPRRRTR